MIAIKHLRSSQRLGGFFKIGIFRLTPCGPLCKRPLRQRKVAAARTARAALQRHARLRKIAGCEAQSLVGATSDPHRIALGPSAARAAKLVSSGGYIAAHRVLH